MQWILELFGKGNDDDDTLVSESVISSDIAEELLTNLGCTPEAGCYQLSDNLFLSAFSEDQTAENANVVELADMTAEQTRIVEAGETIAGSFPQHLPKEDLSTWILEKFRTKRQLAPYDCVITRDGREGVIVDDHGDGHYNVELFDPPGVETMSCDDLTLAIEFPKKPDDAI